MKKSEKQVKEQPVWIEEVLNDGLFFEKSEKLASPQVNLFKEKEELENKIDEEILFN